MKSTSRLLAGVAGFEPTYPVLETGVGGFEDRCVTITPNPYKMILI